MRFTTSGIATVIAGSSSVSVNPGVDVNAATKVLCTMMGDPGGLTVVQRVSRNEGANTFQIILTTNTTANTEVAWFVIS